MTQAEIDGLAAAIRLATEKNLLEYGSFIAIIVSAVISTVALWFIFRQMLSGNEQLRALRDQLGVMQQANLTEAQELKVFGDQLAEMKDSNEALRQQMAADHDRSARALAITLMLHWQERVQFNTRQVASLVNKFDKPQCQALEHLQEFYVKPEDAPLLALCIPEDFPSLKTDDPKGILLSRSAVMKLRFTATSYLNLVESILTAWHQNIVDRDVIEDQFAFLDEDGENALEEYRKIGGIDFFPSTTLFLDRLRENKRHGLPKQPPSPLNRARGGTPPAAGP